MFEETSLGPDCVRAWGVFARRTEIRCLADRFASQIVGGWPQASRGDDHVGALGGGPKDLDVVGEVIADGGMVANLDPEIAQSLTEGLAVGIQTLAAGQLVPDR